MSFTATISDHTGFSDLVNVIKKLGDNCLLRLDLHQVELAVFSNGIVSTAGFFTFETEALFSHYRIIEPINLLIPTREFRQMIYAIKRCNFTNIELKETYLEFKSESTTKGGTIAEEVGELDVKILSDREASDVHQPAQLPPDVCLTLRPLKEYSNFVHGFSQKLESILISASSNGLFRLDYVGTNVFAEHVSLGLRQPELDIDVPIPEDRDQVFKVRVRAKHLSNIMGCEELGVKHTFVSITDESQIMFFVFFSLGGHTQNSLTIHVPLFIE